MKCLGFTTGVISGVALGILFAPANGNTTRERISDTATAVKKKVQALFGKGEDIDTLIASLENKADELTPETKDTLLKILRKIKRNMDV